MDDLQKPLLEDQQSIDSCYTQDNESIQTEQTMVRKPMRKIVVEPVLVIYAFVSFPLQLTLALFVYNKFESEAAVKFGINETDINKTQFCDLNTSSIEYQVTHEAQQHNAFFNICTGLAGAIPCLFSTILLGPYSDKAGRKIVILAPVIGDFVFAMVCLVVAIFKLPVWYLIIGYFVQGLGGKITMLLIGCFAYIADTTEPKDRQFRITVVECVTFLPALLGPLAVGYFIKYLGYVWPIVIIGAVYVVDMLYVIFFVPETVITDGNAKFWTVEHIKKVGQLFTKNTTSKRKYKLIWLYTAFLPVIMVALGDQITTLFLQNLPLCWDSVKIGNYQAIYIAVLTIGGIISAKLFNICLPDFAIALISVASLVVRNTYHAFVKTNLMVYLLPPLSIFAILFIPTIRAMMSKLVGPHEQGAVFSSIAISEVIFGFLGSFIFSSVYASTLSFMTGFVYLVMAGCYFLGFINFLSYVIWTQKCRSAKNEVEEIAEAE